MNSGIYGVGTSLRSQHFVNMMQSQQLVPWIEVLADQYLNSRGILLDKLTTICSRYPNTLHCVSFSIGSFAKINHDYLSSIKKLSDLTGAVCVSDHLCWTSCHGKYSHDLLPLPYSRLLCERISDKINHIQDELGKQFLLENISHYIKTNDDSLAEAYILNEICKSTGAGILLDINNIYVSSCNLKFDAKKLIDAIDPQHVAQYHLAGYTMTPQRLVDSHGEAVHSPVWQLYEYALEIIGVRPTCIEWDHDIPQWSVLYKEVSLANQYLQASLKNKAAKYVSVKNQARHHKVSKNNVRQHKRGLSSVEPALDSKQSMMDVKSFQCSFWEKITTAENLKDDHRYFVYQNSMRLQRLSSLQQIYPCCQKLMGDDFFNHLALQHIIETPSFSADISIVADKFREYLSFNLDAKDEDLYDLARYEYVWYGVFHGCNHGAVDFQLLAEHVNKYGDEVNLHLAQDVGLLHVKYPVLLAWQACQPEFIGKPPVMLRGDYYYAIYQSQGLVRTVELSAGGFQSLQPLTRYMSLATWCDACAHIDDFSADSIAYFYKNGLVKINQPQGVLNEVSPRYTH